MNKIFGIGFHKTATKSLANAFELLGYKTTGPNGVQNTNIQTEVWNVIDPLLVDFEAFQDNPWPLLYPELDNRYPGSKFILTIRPERKWIESVMSHFGGETTPMREWIYGVGDPVGHEEVFLSRYKKHNKEVMDYFARRPEDLLVMDITKGDGWEKLCPFLNKEIPSEHFPRLNSKNNRIDK